MKPNSTFPCFTFDHLFAHININTDALNLQVNVVAVMYRVASSKLQLLQQYKPSKSVAKLKDKRQQSTIKMKWVTKYTYEVNMGTH